MHKSGSGSKVEDLPFVKQPELVFGLVGPIGVDLDYVTEVLVEALESVGYRNARTIRITQLMREVPAGLPLDATGHIDSFRQRISYANRVRGLLGRNDALAILAVSAIRQFRSEERGNEEEPLPGQAYIVRQLKRPEEVKLLRSVYGKQFVQLSVHAPQDYRIRRITVQEVNSRQGLISNVDAESAARALVQQDEIEDTEGSGQNVRDAFP